MKLKTALKRFFLLGFVSLIIYILYSNLRINGTWYGVYNYYENSNTKWSHDNFMVFDNFKQDIIPLMYSGDDVIGKSYFAFGNEIYFGNKDKHEYNNLVIKHFNKDSLVLYSSHQQTSVYQKIPDLLKQKNTVTNFTNKLLQLSSSENKLIDTVFFTDHYFLAKNINLQKKWSDYQYEIKKLNDYKVLITNSSIKFIIKEKNKNLYFYQFHEKGLHEIKVKIIESNKILNSEIKTKLKRMKKKRAYYNEREEISQDSIKN